MIKIIEIKSLKVSFYIIWTEGTEVPSLSFQNLLVPTRTPPVPTGFVPNPVKFHLIFYGSSLLPFPSWPMCVCVCMPEPVCLLCICVCACMCVLHVVICARACGSKDCPSNVFFVFCCISLRQDPVSLSWKLEVLARLGQLAVRATDACSRPIRCLFFYGYQRFDLRYSCLDNKYPYPLNPLPIPTPWLFACVGWP